MPEGSSAGPVWVLAQEDEGKASSDQNPSKIILMDSYFLLQKDSATVEDLKPKIQQALKDGFKSMK